MCDRWRDSFEAFESDMGPRPSKQHTIDRFPNKCGNYEPGNCRWATMFEQNRNRKSNILLTVDGVTKCATDWALDRGLKPSVVLRRIRRGKSIEQILFNGHLQKDKCSHAASLF